MHDCGKEPSNQEAGGERVRDRDQPTETTVIYKGGFGLAQATLSASDGDEQATKPDIRAIGD